MKIIIRKEPEPLLQGGKGKSYVAYYEDGTPVGKRAIHVQPLKDWIQDDYPDEVVEFQETPPEAECQEVFDKVRSGDMCLKEFVDWSLNFRA